jgi:hypothetical protein
MLLSRNKYGDSESRFWSCSDSLWRLVGDEAYVAYSGVTWFNRARARHVTHTQNILWQLSKALGAL